MTKPDPFRYFKTSREIIRLAVMLYVRFPLSLRNVEDLLHERGIDVSHEALRYWWHRLHASVSNHFNQERNLSSGPLFKANRAAALAG